MSSKTPQNWRDMDDETRANAYSPSKALPDGDLMPFIQRYIDLSAKAYARCPHLQTLIYGDKPANSLDVVTPTDANNAACLVFIHGGYWQELSKKESFLPAMDCLGHDMAYAAIDYTLAPGATLDEIAEECTAAYRELLAKTAALGIDRNRIVLSGSSAGAQLAAMVCSKLNHDEMPRGAVFLSGIYDLEPLIGTYINDALGLDLAAAQRNSPMRFNLNAFPKSLVAWGQVETAEFKRQSRDFAAKLPIAEVFEVPARNHFDILEDLANDSALAQKMRALVAL